MSRFGSTGGGDLTGACSASLSKLVILARPTLVELLAAPCEVIFQFSGTQTGGDQGSK